MGISLEHKELLAWNKMTCLSSLKSFQLSEIVSDPRVGI